MSLPIDREFVTQAVIALGACLGGWLVFVNPKAEELKEVEAAIAKHTAETASMDLSGIELVANLAPELRRRCDEIDRRNRTALDSSLLYGRFMEVATLNGIKVKNLRPTVERSSDKSAVMSVTRVDVTGEGTYEQIANFFDGLNNIGAYVRPISVQLTPTKRDSEESAVLQLGCEAVQFQLPPAIEPFRETGNDDA